MSILKTRLPNAIKVVMLKGEKGDKGDKGDDGDYIAQQYSSLNGKPSINGVTLSGNMTSNDLGLSSSSDLDTISDEVSALENNALLKSNVAVTKLVVGTSGTISVSAGNYTNLDFDISGLVSSANNVIGLQRHRLAKSDSTEADGMIITDATIETISGNLRYRLRAYNATDSAIVLSKAQTYIYLVTFS